MFRGCLGQILTVFIVGLLILWFFRAPESVAGLITGFVGMIAGAADAIGRFASSLAPLFSAI
ncbi:hypothetical protein [Nocardiopsis sp. NPDC057823]|uniref:hypothetical protein n=1 Tax=Nocardiopsis sp. NPDC057823 TaxID=3346256 RepID=UPI00366EF606